MLWLQLWQAFGVLYRVLPGPAVHERWVAQQPSLLLPGLNSTSLSLLHLQVWGSQLGHGVPDQGTAGQLWTRGWEKAKLVPHLSGCSEPHSSCAKSQDSPRKPPWRHTHTQCPLALAKEL